MGKKKTKTNINVIVLGLLSITNLLALISPRTDDENSIARLPIQLITGLVLVLMWGTLFSIKKHFTPVTKYLTLFIILMVIYCFTYIANSPFLGPEFSPYIKFLTWITAIIFFYETFILYGINNRAMRFFIITTILAIAKEILVTSKFESASLGAGDTASLPLLFIMPIILMMFNKRNRMILIIAVFALVLISLRRTSILGAVCCVPFLYKDMKKSLKPGFIVAALVLFCITLVVTWHFLGDAITYRFSEITRGNDKGEYGSGRSGFYLLVWDSWWGGSADSVIFGNGLTTLRHLLMREHFGLEHAHNDFLEIGYTFGVVGISIWILFLKGFWSLKRKLKRFSPSSINMFYISFLSYMIIGLASGCVLRTTTISFSLTISMFLYIIYNGKKENDKIRYDMLNEQSMESSKNEIVPIKG